MSVTQSGSEKSAQKPADDTSKRTSSGANPSEEVRETGRTFFSELVGAPHVKTCFSCKLPVYGHEALWVEIQKSDGTKGVLPVCEWCEMDARLPVEDEINTVVP